jgi:hypothetical protein
MPWHYCLILFLITVNISPKAGEVKVSFFAGNVTFSNKVTCVVMHPNDFKKDHATLFRFAQPEKNVSFDLYKAILACHWTT